VKLSPKVTRGRPPPPPRGSGSPGKGSDEPTNEIDQFPPPKQP
jgi:hypothetical protein